MVDLSKPQGLTGLHQAEPTPSLLTKPYDLIPKYDAAAGGGGQYINTTGVNSLAVGAVQLAYSQIIYPAGINSCQFGNNRPRNTAEQAALIGFDSSAFSTPTIYNFLKF
ncbi:MAG: hypothetical protein ACEQSD_10150, partial [Flavobacteriales bacterium]